MAGGPIFAQIQIKFIILLFKPQLFHPLQKLFIVLFSLAPADNLSDARNQTVHGRHRFSIRILFHIECLNFLRIIRHKDRPPEDFLRQAALMLRLQVAAPCYLIFKLIIMLFQETHRLRIRHTAEFRIHHMIQPFQKPAVNQRMKEIHLLRRFLQHIADHIFQHGFCQLHIILQVRESHLRLNHPELRRMAGGIGILRPECGAKGIDLPESLGKCLPIQLPADSQIRHLPEKILRIIHRPVACARRIIQIQRGHLKHFSRPFTITPRNQRSVNIDKPPFLEKTVDGIRCQRPHAENRLKSIRSGPEMRNRPQIFQRMALFLKGIIRSRSPFHSNFLRLDLKRLLRLRRRHQSPPDQHRSSHIQSGNLREIIYFIFIYNLKSLKKRSVM